MLKPIFDELLPALEEAQVSRIEQKANRALLPKELVREIAADAKWPVGAKKGLAVVAPNATADGLNKLGLSSEYKDLAILGTCISTILIQQSRLNRKLDKLIANANAHTVKPGQAKP